MSVAVSQTATCRGELSGHIWSLSVQGRLGDGSTNAGGHTSFTVSDAPFIPSTLRLRCSSVWEVLLLDWSEGGRNKVSFFKKKR